VNPPPLLQLSNIEKSFGPVRVLDGVSFELRAGEVHLLAGENGAGKSTLIKILAGVHQEYGGEIRLNGKVRRFRSPQEANRAGISVIHQEMSLVESLGVADNIFLAREPVRAAGWLDRRRMAADALALCHSLDLDFDIADMDRPVAEFAMSVRSRLEIAKALSFDARVLVMDEPTSALNRQEVEILFALIGKLRAQGCGIIYISHKMEEIYRIADRITVLRDGRHVGTDTAENCPQSKLVQQMIGRELSGHFPPRNAPAPDSPVVLEVSNFSVPATRPDLPEAVKEVSFHVCKGEILGLAGLQGSGASELLQGLFGALGPIARGQIKIGGKEFAVGDPRRSIASRMALLTGDRKGTGLVLNLSVVENLTLAALPRFSPRGLLAPGREEAVAHRDISALRIKAASVAQAVGSLSGGNQQKVVLAKWQHIEPQILLLDEPTRGVDVGAKHEIYELMNRWTAEGQAIVMISTELPELLGMCDCIIVMHRGAVTAEFSRDEASSDKILLAAMGAGA
jgi:ABC-type sugar transport system ATPase subunit